MNWINPSDTTPEHNELVLALIDEGFGPEPLVVVYGTDERDGRTLHCWQNPRCGSVLTVTHWLPIPPLPEVRRRTSSTHTTCGREEITDD